MRSVPVERELCAAMGGSCSAIGSTHSRVCPSLLEEPRSTLKSVRAGDPGKTPAHTPLVGLQLLERRLRDECERHVASVQVREQAVDAVGHRRAGRATGLVARAEHEVVDEQLGSPVEQLDERLLAVVRVEAVVLLHPHPRQLAAPLRDLVAEPGVLLFADE
jgi:hypothetical protein